MKSKMFATILFFTFLFLTVCSAQQNQNKTIVINDYLKVIEIEDGVFRVIHKFPWTANSLLVKVGEKDFVLCDTPIENTGSEALVEWMRENFGEFNLTVINCHFHIDCLGGNHYMLSQGFPVYATDMTLQLFEGDKQNIIPRMLNGMSDPGMIEIIKNLQLVPPDKIFKAEAGLTLQFGDEEVDLYYPGGGHTKDNIVVYFPEKKILYGGCMVKAFEQSDLGYQSFSDMEAWPQSLQNLLDKYQDAEIVVPGHGAQGDMTMINHTMNLLKHD